MSLLRSRVPVACLPWLLVVSPLTAQSVTCDSTRNPWAFLRQCAASALPQGDTVSLARGFQQAITNLKSPASLNPALVEFGRATRTRNVLGAMNLHFLLVQRGYQQGLGLSYDLKRELVRTPHKQGSAHGGFHSGLEFRGTLVPSADSNPEDFNESTVHASFFYGRGGAVSPAVMRAHLVGLADSAERYQPSEAYLSSPEYLRFMAAMWDSLSTQLYITGGPEARYESTQGGHRTQWAVGARLGADLKAWNPHRGAARFNVFDWPAAFVRWATGTDAVFRPSGAAIPTVSLLLHRVTPGANALRDSLHNLDPFTRIALELRSRTLLTSVPEGPVWLVAEFRHHLEIDAPQRIMDAGQHRHSRLQLQVETPGGFTLSYARGNFPLAESGADRWGLGYQFRYR